MHNLKHTIRNAPRAPSSLAAITKAQEMGFEGIADLDRRGTAEQKQSVIEAYNATAELKGETTHGI